MGACRENDVFWPIVLAATGTRATVVSRVVEISRALGVGRVILCGVIVVVITFAIEFTLVDLMRPEGVVRVGVGLVFCL